MPITSRSVKGFKQEVSNGRHTVTVDEPQDAGGEDSGPRPTELLAMSLASCTGITLQMYAQRKQIDLTGLEVDVSYELNPAEGSVFDITLKLPSDLTEDQVQRLKVIAGKCPVHRALAGSIEVIDSVEQLPT